MSTTDIFANSSDWPLPLIFQPKKPSNNSSLTSAVSPNMPIRSLMGSFKSKLGSQAADKSSLGGMSTASGRNTDAAPRIIGGMAARADPKDPFNVPQPTRRPDRPGMNAFTTPSNEPPPAYTATSLAPPSEIQRPTTPADDPYAFLSTFDTIFLVDDSGSMAGRSWRECSQALEAIAPICTEHDHDGIDLFFLNAPAAPFHKNITEPSTVHEIFDTVRPRGGTPIGQRLNQILKPYLASVENAPEGSVKPMNVIVITDGVPSDDVESVLINAAKKLDKLEAVSWQVGVQFMQVGNEQGAREYLEGLDDELASMGGGCRDIVDTVPLANGAALTAEGILKCVLGAVNRRLDRRAI